MERARKKELQEKSLKGLLTIDEMKEIIVELRKDRVSAGFASKGAKAKKAATKKEKEEFMAEDLFKDLMDDNDGD